LPYLDEGSFWIRATFPEGISLKENAKYSNQLRELIKSYPEVKFVLSQSGRVDTGTDPYPLNRCEMMVGLNPPEEWKNFRTKIELEHALQERLKSEFPTIRLNLTQPIMDGVAEDTNGTSADLAVEFSGPDLEVLRKLGNQASSILSSISGNRNVYREQEGPQPQLQVKVDRQRIAAYQVPGDAVMSVINSAVGGQPITSIFENERRFNINVKYLEDQMGNPSNLGLLPVFNDQGQPIPLAQLADIRIVDGETLIARSNGLRRITIRTDIRDRSQGEFVAEAQEKFQKSIQLPDGYFMGWKGMFENLDRARKHFAFLIPLTILIIFSVLLVSFNSIKTSSIVLLNLPFALIGSAVALFVRGMHLSVSAGVGFTSLFGVSVMQGMLMINTINDLRTKDGFSLRDSVCTGAKQRLRPILMTSLTAMIGLFPASLATGVGTDVQRPIATVVVWGIFSAALVTLFVLPVIYITAFSSDKKTIAKN
jgi:cobalt-zinc-cadmium resistance protein CzcA